ncbi:MAG: DUF4143 domain-containing protein, partial [Pseudomonadota bacterium]
IYQAYHTSANGLPLYSGTNEKKFKLFFLDIGLILNALDLSAEIILNEHLILLNRGALAEQFVGQELIAYAPNYKIASLYYWEREKTGSTAEIDYVINVDSNITPIEVKAGKSGRLKSLQVFLNEKKLNLGVQISQGQFKFENRILTIPLYLIAELPRLVREFHAKNI